MLALIFPGEIRACVARGFVVFSASHLSKEEIGVFGLGGCTAQTEHPTSFFCLQRVLREP